MSQKTVVSLELFCSKCRKKVMQLIAGIEEINSIVLDPSKGTATIIGEADPAIIIKKVKKFQKSAKVVTVGPLKEEKKDEKKDLKEEKKDEKKHHHLDLPKTCQRCDTWFVINEYPYGPCSIL